MVLSERSGIGKVEILRERERERTNEVTVK